MWFVNYNQSKSLVINLQGLSKVKGCNFWQKRRSKVQKNVYKVIETGLVHYAQQDKQQGQRHQAPKFSVIQRPPAPYWRDKKLVKYWKKKFQTSDCYQKNAGENSRKQP